MSERPLIFTSESVRGLLAGTKTQTRRLVKPQPVGGVRQSPFVPGGLEDGHGRPIRVPWSPGDHVWVRETWARIYDVYPFGEGDPSHIEYRADGDPKRFPGDWPREFKDDAERPHWKSPFFLKRIDSRIALEITDVRAQRLQYITEEDARAEGMQFHDGHGVGHSGWRHDVDYGVVCGTAREAFATAWDIMHGKDAPWSSDPWVFALSFAKLTHTKVC